MIDVNLSGNEYQDIYVLSGITRGKGLIIQNKSHRHVILNTSQSKPDADDTSGYMIEPFPTDPIYVDLFEFDLWAIGRGPICIQEL